MKKQFSATCLLFLAFLFLTSSVAQCDKGDESRSDTDDDLIRESEYAFIPDKTRTTPVSPLLLGFNLIYPHEKNAIWQDGKIAGYLKDVNVGFLRYPGGTVCSFYHWNSLTGEGWKESWDPENPVAAKSSSEFMDIDEYMSLVRTTGATPLLGINMSSGWRWNRKEDGIKEAMALMQYCRDKNFRVDYWYLDNEPYQDDSNGGPKTPEEYAALINAYVPVMKAFNPDIKIVANWNAGFKNKRSEYNKLIQLSGANIDIIDAHWYWSWNDTSWEKWLQKTPIEQWTGFTYAEDIAYFRQMVSELGFPKLKLASFEWNTGPVKPGNSLTASRAALVQAEMMMQLISGGLDYAVFWPIHWPDEATKPRSFVNTANNSANPDYPIFKFLGQMQGGMMTGAETSKNYPDMVSLSVHDVTHHLLRICVLNKNRKDVVTDIRLEKFPGIQFREADRYTVNQDGTDYLLDKVTLLKPGKKEVAKFLSKSYSLTMLTFEEK